MVSPVTASALEFLPLEILEGILSALCRADLAKCVRICRSWNYLLIPYLWHTIAIRSPSQVEKFLTRDAQLALLNNAEFVRELRLDHADLYDRLLSSRDIFCWDIGIATNESSSGAGTALLFNNLHSLELYPPRHSLHSRRPHGHNIAALVRQNPGIQRLVINIAIERLTLLNLLANHLGNLQHFELAVIWRGNLEIMFRNLPESIRTLKLREVRHEWLCHGDDEEIEAASIKEMIELTVVKPHHALETFHIDGILGGYGCLIPFLKSCSSRLKNVSGLHDAFYRDKELVKTLLEIGLRWKVLNQDILGHDVSEEQLVEVISGSSDWTHITLDTDAVSHSVAASIVDHCETLEVLHITHSTFTGIRRFDFQAVLSKARRLRSLKAPWLLVKNMITAADILSSEWATTSLECIDFKIDVPRCHDTDDHEAIQASRDIQRKVMRRLGQQKHLRELKIGGVVQPYTMTSFSYNLNCLEMTLQSGLDELAGLKELEVIDIYGMDHGVGVAELMWMDKNLPKLRSIIGLWNTGYWSNGYWRTARVIPQGALLWQQTHRPDWNVESKRQY